MVGNIMELVTFIDYRNVYLTYVQQLYIFVIYLSAVLTEVEARKMQLTICFKSYANVCCGLVSQRY